MTDHEELVRRLRSAASHSHEVGDGHAASDLYEEAADALEAAAALLDERDYVRVPKEPTKEMLDAGIKAFHHCWTSGVDVLVGVLVDVLVLVEVLVLVLVEVLLVVVVVPGLTADPSSAQSISIIGSAISVQSGRGAAVVELVVVLVELVEDVVVVVTGTSSNAIASMSQLSFSPE